MSKVLPHIDEMKAAVLAGETYSAVATRFGVFPADVHRALKVDPDIVKAKETGQIRQRNKPRRSLADLLCDPAVVDVTVNGMTTNAAARKHGIPQATLWKRVQEVKALDYVADNESVSAAVAAQQVADPELTALRALIQSYADRKGLTLLSVLTQLA